MRILYESTLLKMTLRQKRYKQHHPWFDAEADDYAYTSCCIMF
jgi:hypothetical protein